MMSHINEYNEFAATFIARIFLGLLFFFQGYDALFKVKVQNIIEAYEPSFAARGIPKFLTVSGAWFTSVSELLGGLSLCLGLFQDYTLYLLAVNILIASIAFSISTPMWDMKFVFPRLALLLFLFLIPSEWNAWSIDNLIITLKR